MSLFFTSLLDADLAQAHEEAVRVMSFNIRQDDDPKHDWNSRKGRVVSILRFHRPDLVGLQEPYQQQLKDLAVSLPEFSFFTGEEIGVYNPILFRKGRFDLIDSGFFYLSPTPEAPSKGWDAKFLRGVSWVKLFDRKSEQVLYFFNTHFDYHSRLARDESAHLLRKKVIEIANSYPFIVAGDFNLFPQLGGKTTYQILTDEFVDAEKIALFPHHGPTGTWSGFKEAGQPGVKPDFIFVAPSVEVYHHAILADTFDGQFPSDHLPVVADVVIP